MKSVHFLPNIITAFGLSCGLFAIFKIAMIPTAEMNLHVLIVTAGILMLAAIADLLDGAVARVMKAESDFGGVFDSLADAISFGVAPAVIILKSHIVPPKTELSFLLTTAAMVYAVCGVLRLARYSSMSPNNENIHEPLDIHKKHFIGLPIPAAAAAAVSLNLFFVSEEFTSFFEPSIKLRAWVLVFVMLGLGYFMISKWKFPSLKSLQIRVGSFHLVFATVAIAVIMFYGFLHHFPVVFFVLSWSYLVGAWILAIRNRIKGIKNDDSDFLHDA